MADLRTTIAAHVRQQISLSPDNWSQAAINAADAILAIPEIRSALASVAILEGERKMFANYRADMGRLINGNEKA